MKKYFAVFFAAILVLSLTGCSLNRSSSSVPEVSLPPASLSVVGQESSKASSSETESEGLGDPAVTSAKTLIESAMEVYSWLALGAMPLSEDSTTSLNPMTGTQETFQLVNSEHFSNYEEFKSYLENFFSGEIVQKYLEEYQICKDIDGKLWMVPAGRGANIMITDVAFETVEVTEDKAHLTATVYYDEDAQESNNPKVCDFILEKIDGRWIFTQFPYYL